MKLYVLGKIKYITYHEYRLILDAEVIDVLVGGKGATDKVATVAHKTLYLGYLGYLGKINRE